MNSGTGIFIILCIALGVVILHFLRKKFKFLKVPSVFLISGAVKTGKTLLSVHLAIKQYKKNLRRWYIKKFLATFLHREISPRPMLYSNLKLRWVKFNEFTYEILFRQVRIPDKSVVLLDEVSLLADSMLFKNQKINNQLMLFVKLFAHYTHGGSLYVNTQAVQDLHFSFKRSLNQYVYIYSSQRFPFITIMKVREMISMGDSVANSFSEDVELSMRTMVIFNRNYNRYDRYCYSIFTDKLPYQVNYDVEILKRSDSLKNKNLITLQDFSELLGVRYEKK